MRRLIMNTTEASVNLITVSKPLVAVYRLPGKQILTREVYAMALISNDGIDSLVGVIADEHGMMLVDDWEVFLGYANNATEAYTKYGKK